MKKFFIQFRCTADKFSLWCKTRSFFYGLGIAKTELSANLILAAFFSKHLCLIISAPQLSLRYIELSNVSVGNLCPCTAAIKLGHDGFEAPLALREIIAQGSVEISLPVMEKIHQRLTNWLRLSHIDRLSRTLAVASKYSKGAVDGGSSWSEI